MLEAIKTSDRGIVCSFVGTGKSLVKSELVKQTEGHTLLVFPSLNLVDQFVSRYAPNAFVITTERPKQQSEIKNNFSNNRGVTVVTYQSLHKLRKYFPKLSLALFDEAHHICTNRIIDLLEDLQQTRRFFFTATPRETKTLSMFVEPSDDESEYTDAEETVTERSKRLLGGLIYEYGFTNAMQDGVVTDYSLGFAAYQQTDEPKEQAQLRNILRLARNHNRKRILVYNQYVSVKRNGKTTTSNFVSGGTYVRQVTGKTSSQERKEIFDWFQEQSDEVRVLCNVGTIKEGVDLPCIDLIAFCDEKHSRIDIIQCLGRGLRLYSNKRDCLVACCVPITGQEISGMEFKTIKDVLLALKSIDSRVEDVLLGKPSSLAMYYEGEGQVSLESEGFYQVVKLGVFGNWYAMLEGVDKFLGDKGKRPSHGSKDLEEKRLGKWLSHQVKDYRKDKLPQDRAQAFKTMVDKYPSLFDEDKNDKVWYAMLEGVDKFLSDKGKRPSEKTKDPEEKRLGQWLAHQLQLRGKDNLPQDRAQAFKTMVDKYPSLFDEDKDDKVWYAMLEGVDKFLSDKGKRPARQSKDPQEKRLGVWLSDQVTDYRKDKLPQDRAQAFKTMIDKYPSLFDEDKGDKVWYATLEGVDKFLSDKGKRPSNVSKDPKEKRLGQWLSHQLHGKDKLPQDRAQAFKGMVEKYPSLFDGKKTKPHQEESKAIVAPQQQNNTITFQQASNSLEVRDVQRTNEEVHDPQQTSDKVWDCDVRAVSIELDQYGEIRSKQLQFWWRKTKRSFDKDGLSPEQRLDIQDLIYVFGLK